MLGPGTAPSFSSSVPSLYSSVSALALLGWKKYLEKNERAVRACYDTNVLLSERRSMAELNRVGDPSRVQYIIDTFVHQKLQVIC